LRPPLRRYFPVFLTAKGGKVEEIEVGSDPVNAACRRIIGSIDAVELANWAAQYDSETDAPQGWIAAVNADRQSMINLIRDTVQDGGSVFSGPNSVVSKITMIK